MAHYKGYEAARAKVEQMGEDDLLKLIDDLYGRNNLPVCYTLDDLRAEALAQHSEDWTDRPTPSSEQFWQAVMEAYSRQKGY